MQTPELIFDRQPQSNALVEVSAEVDILDSKTKIAVILTKEGSAWTLEQNDKGEQAVFFLFQQRVFTHYVNG